MIDMGKFKIKRALGENGLSLVEVLASFVILTLLLTTFLMMFIQSAKVNKSSEHIIDATYIAQTEMENMYALSKTTKNGAKEVRSIIQRKAQVLRVSKHPFLICQRCRFYRRSSDHLMRRGSRHRR